MTRLTAIPTLSDIVKRHNVTPKLQELEKHSREEFYTTEVLFFSENKINTSFQGHPVAAFFVLARCTMFTASRNVFSLSSRSFSLCTRLLCNFHIFSSLVTQEASDKRRPCFYGSADDARVFMIMYSVCTYCTAFYGSRNTWKCFCYETVLK